MKLLRDVIYVGESGVGTVYFDTKRNLVLAAPQSRLLNTEGARRTNRLIPIIIGISILGGTGVVTVANPFGGYYSYGTLVFLLTAWIIECVGFVWLLERALYKNVKKAEPTERQNFRTAVYGHLVWSNFGDKKVTRGKKIWAWVIVIIMAIVSLVTIPLISEVVLVDIKNQAPIGSEIIKASMWGFMPAIFVILVWQNNPIRFFNLVGKYQKREIKWGTK